MSLLKMVSRVEELESEEISDHRMMDIMALLIESGEVWKLRGSFGRVATTLIDEGYIDSNGKVLKYP